MLLQTHFHLELTQSRDSCRDSVGTFQWGVILLSLCFCNKSVTPDTNIVELSPPRISWLKESSSGLLLDFQGPCPESTQRTLSPVLTTTWTPCMSSFPYIHIPTCLCVPSFSRLFITLPIDHMLFASGAGWCVQIEIPPLCLLEAPPLYTTCRFFSGSMWLGGSALPETLGPGSCLRSGYANTYLRYSQSTVICKEAK